MAYQGGGRTDKAGNKYETNYFIYLLLMVLEEELYSVTLEPIGDDEEGTDILVVHKDGELECRQCKGRNFNKDKWTLGAINAYHIFDKWKFQLERSERRNVALVSPIAFVVLEDLIGIANTSSGEAKSFYEDQILKSNVEIKKAYNDYCNYMKLDITDEKDILKSIDYLKRTQYYQIQDTNLKILLVKPSIKYLFNEDEEKVYDVLLDFVINGQIWGKSIDFITISKYLENKGITLRNLAYDKRVAPRIAVLNNEYDNWFRAINEKMFERKEFIKCRDLIENGNSIIISGKAGYGKSGIVQLIVENCKDNDIPYIAIKLDKRIPEKNAKQWGMNLGLPASISYCIDSISKEKQAVIILDQLDALRWTQSNSMEALQVCKELIDEVKNINQKREKNISIVLVCRTYDLKNDNNIKSLFIEENNKWEEIQIGKFSTELVKEVVGEQYKNNSKKLNELLEIPSNLFIWTQLDRSKSYDDCYTTNRLIEEWWQQLTIKANSYGVDETNVRECIEEIVKKMQLFSKSNITRKFIKVNENALNYLYSSGILLINEENISFTHQRVLDYFVESKMITMFEEGKTIEEIVGDLENQTPSKRYQVQMFFEDLLDLDSSQFIKMGKQMLDSKNIRFYIKHVFYEVLGQTDAINNEIESFILENYNNEIYGKYLLEDVLLGNLKFIKILIRNGVFDEWMDDNKKIGMCVYLLRSINDEYDTEIAEFFSKYILKNKDIDKKILECLSYEIHNEIKEIFEIRMKLYEKYPENSSSYVDFRNLFKKNEMRAIRLIKFWLEHKMSNKTIYKYEEELVTDESEIIINSDEEIINMLLPCIPKEIDRYYGKWNGRFKYSVGIERAAVNIIKKANTNLIRHSPEKFWEIYKTYMGQGYYVFNEFILEGFATMPEEYSDRIIEYLTKDFIKNSVDISSGNGDRLLTVKRILQKHSETCNDSNFRKLEDTIYYYLEENAKELYLQEKEYRDLYSNKKLAVHWNGNLQVELIPFLCAKRVSRKTVELLNVLQRKFYNGSEYYKYNDGHSGSVMSPITGKKLSNKQWLRLLSNEELKTKEGRNWKGIKGGFVESSIREFAISFSDAVAKEPNRMSNLVLNSTEKILGEYIDALYIGLQTSEKIDEVPNDVIEALVRKFPCDNISQTARNICWTIDKKNDSNWSQYILDWLKNVAVYHKDPRLDNPNVTSAEDKEMKGVEMLQTNSLNCTRGAAAKTIAKLINKKNEYFDMFKNTMETIIIDENPAVRFASLFFLEEMFYINKEWAKQIILELFAKDERFLSYWGARRLLFQMYADEKNMVLNIIKKAYYSEFNEIKAVGALAVAEMNIIHGEFSELINKVEEMDETQIEKIIRIIEHYYNDNEYNQKCKQIILRMNKCGYDLEGFVVQIFYNENVDIKRDSDFVIEIMKTNSGRRALHAVIRYIEKSSASLLELSEMILGILNGVVDGELDRANLALYEDELTKLVVLLYDETEGKSDIKNKGIAQECLKIWDKMYEKQIGSIRKLSREILDR